MATTPPRAQSTYWTRIVGVVVVWVVATVTVLLVAADTKFGPVVLTLSRRHGVHAGDVLTLVVAYAAAAVLTRTILRPR